MAPVAKKSLVAPVYRPSVAYHPPVAAPFRLNVDSVSLEELRSAPATWKIVLAHAPAFGELVSAPDISPYLSTMSLDSFVPFDLITSEQLRAIDDELVNLPRQDWPAL